MEIIEIKWDGPYSIDEVKKLNGDSDYGLYQVYSGHHIFGPDTLIYIGKANNQTFAKRLSQQQEWITWETSPQIYVGRLGGDKRVTDNKWGKMINNAEKILIYFSSPPYNSTNIGDYGKIKNTIVLNVGKKNRLPFEYSTYYHQTKYDESKWQLYG